MTILRSRPTVVFVPVSYLSVSINTTINVLCRLIKLDTTPQYDVIDVTWNRITEDSPNYLITVNNFVVEKDIVCTRVLLR